VHLFRVMSTNDATTSGKTGTEISHCVDHLTKSEQSLEVLCSAQPDNTSFAEWKRDIAGLKAELQASLDSKEDTDFGTLVEAAVSRQSRLSNVCEQIIHYLGGQLDPEHPEDQSKWTEDQRQQYDALSHLSQACKTHGSIEFEASVETWAQLSHDKDAAEETQPAQNQQTRQDDLQADEHGGEDN
jgi:hypothetical protein